MKYDLIICLLLGLISLDQFNSVNAKHMVHKALKEKSKHAVDDLSQSIDDSESFDENVLDLKRLATSIGQIKSHHKHKSPDAAEAEKARQEAI